MFEKITWKTNNWPLDTRGYLEEIWYQISRLISLASSSSLGFWNRTRGIRLCRKSWRLCFLRAETDYRLLSVGERRTVFFLIELNESKQTILAGFLWKKPLVFEIQKFCSRCAGEILAPSFSKLDILMVKFVCVPLVLICAKNPNVGAFLVFFKLFLLKGLKN